jgi:hypothetical protein
LICCLKRLALLALVLSGFAGVARAQFITNDRLPASSGCNSPYKYDSGVNIAIDVLTTHKSEPTIERIIAQDLSRFKDTGRIRAVQDGPVYAGPIEFLVTILWTELPTNGGTAGYTAALVMMEHCSSFENGEGLSIRDLTMGTPFVDLTKEGLIDRLEKVIYNHVMTTVRQRRSKN